MTGRIAVLGDVGGHLACLQMGLLRLGVRPTSRTLPEDITVVQVGDLVGGPDDAAVVELADEMMAANPGRWCQLVGNWEARHVGGVWFDARRDTAPLDQATVRQLRRWVEDGAMVAAVALQTSRGPVLVTHAGVTAGFWRTMLHEQSDHVLVARALNIAVQAAPGLVLDVGGPAWAWSTQELYPSWLRYGGPVPFGQIHGHSSPYLYGGRLFRPECPREVADRVHVDVRRRRCWLDIGDRRFVAADPGIGRRPSGTELWPLVFEGSVASACASKVR